MSEWKECTIGDLGKIMTGKTPRTAISENYGGKVPFLSPSDNMEIKYVDKTNKTLTEQGVDEVKNCLLPANAVCVSCIGSDLGKVLITTQPTVTNQQINSIIVNEDNDTDFIYYLMTIVGKHLNFISKTSTAVPIINKTTFSNYKISVPLHSEQKKIAAILSSLDEKIETNRKINARLEELAQALFKSWFIDFEPFGGKMPDDWEMGKLGHICKCVLGGTPNRAESEFWNGNIPWINSGEVNKFRIFEPSEFITELGLEKSATKLLPKGTVVLAITGATLGQVSLLEIDTCANQSVVGILETSEMPFTYLYPFINSSIAELIKLQTGGAQQHINKQNVESMTILIPSKQAMIQYDSIVRPIFDKIACICFESARLAALRDALLPKLMSGEIKLS